MLRHLDGVHVRTQQNPARIGVPSLHVPMRPSSRCTVLAACLAWGRGLVLSAMQYPRWKSKSRSDLDFRRVFSEIWNLLPFSVFREKSWSRTPVSVSGEGLCRADWTPPEGTFSLHSSLFGRKRPGRSHVSLEALGVWCSSTWRQGQGRHSSSRVEKYVPADCSTRGPCVYP